MRKLCQLVTIATAAMLASGAAFAGAGAPGHGHESYSAGEPGDPKKAARTVVVTMREGDGKMVFIPNRFEIKRGEQNRIGHRR